MKRTCFSVLYAGILLAILSTNQASWFSGPKTSHHKPLFNEAYGFVKTLIPTKIDPDIDKSWALNDDQAIQIQKAWKEGSCSKEIVVAVVDTGIDYNHPDLKENLWKNSHEIPNNKKDDDHNGFIDDVMGWDFVSGDSLPYDDHGHGTHIAGIIGAVGQNGIGISGVCQRVSLMILKYYDPTASGRENLENTVRAFQYAVNNGAHIINYSGGGSQFSEAEHQILTKARQKEILVIAAAGNEQQNADIYGYYPASYDLDNIISVAAMTKSKELVGSSNYGVKRIDVAAPGHHIYSTIPNGKYGYMTGTSQATAFVTGIAALALSQNRALSVERLKEILLSSITPLSTLKDKIKTGGMIDAHQVVQKVHPAQSLTSLP